MSERTLAKQTLKEAWEQGTAVLDEQNIEEARLDAGYLLEYVTGINRTMYYARPDKVMEPEQLACYQTLIRKRASRIPLQHITGQQEFMGLNFRVNEHVLIPRQDTEVLVETAIGLAEEWNQSDQKIEDRKILDMCTGSGCIIISLYHFLHGKGCYKAVDISGEALDVAKENAGNHNARIEFLQGDLFAPVTDTYDMIVSNPPYIPTAVIEGLQTEVKSHDPYIALDGKEDGLFFYREIIKNSMEHMNFGGWLVFEIGHDQAAAVQELMKEAGFEKLAVKKDLAGLDRVVLGMYNNIM